MTPLHSSTSSSDTRRYLVTLLAVLALFVVGLIAVTATGYRLGLVAAANQLIYSYQMEKVSRATGVEVAFVGDSSLGNAIDARLFTELSGRKTINLALNGSYGSGGALNMTRRMLAKPDLKLVVVLQTIDVLHRDDAFAGFYFSADPMQLLTVPPVQIVELYFSLKTARRMIDQLRHSGAEPPQFIEDDYVSQKTHAISRPPKVEVAVNPLRPDMLARSQLDYLARLAELCRAHGVRCVYANGPIYDGYCEQAADYIAALDDAVEAAGLPVTRGTPICMPERDVGNSIDHVRSDLKQDYTRRYYALLRATIASLGS